MGWGGDLETALLDRRLAALVPIFSTFARKVGTQTARIADRICLVSCRQFIALDIT